MDEQFNYLTLEVLKIFKCKIRFSDTPDTWKYLNGKSNFLANELLKILWGKILFLTLKLIHNIRRTNSIFWLPNFRKYMDEKFKFLDNLLFRNISKQCDFLTFEIIIMFGSKIRFLKSNFWYYLNGRFNFLSTIWKYLNRKIYFLTFEFLKIFGSKIRAFELEKWKKNSIFLHSNLRNIWTKNLIF